MAHRYNLRPHHHQQHFVNGDFTNRVERVEAPELGLNQWKLMTIGRIFAGEFMEYTGRVIRSQEEFNQYQRRHNSSKTLQLGTRTPPLFIVATETSLCGAFNHCCHCVAPVEVQVDQQDRHRAFLVARQEIEPGTELRFDYGYRYDVNIDGNDETMNWMIDWYCPNCNPRPIIAQMMVQQEEMEQQQHEVIDLTGDSDNE